MINYINFLNILWIIYEKSWFILTSVRLKNSSHDTGPQTLNNPCSHYIKNFQVLCERVRDSTKAYRTIYKCSYIRFTYERLYVYVYVWFKISLAVTEWCECNCMLFRYVCMYRMTNGRLEVRTFFLREPYHCQLE